MRWRSGTVKHVGRIEEGRRELTDRLHVDRLGSLEAEVCVPLLPAAVFSTRWSTWTVIASGSFPRLGTLAIGS